MEIRKFPLSPDISPLKGFAIFSRSSQSILELIRALERGDDAGHDELCFKLQCIREGRQKEIRKFHERKIFKRPYLAFARKLSPDS